MKRVVKLSQREVCEIIGDYAMEHLLPDDIEGVSVHIDIDRSLFGEAILTCRVEEV